MPIVVCLGGLSGGAIAGIVIAVLLVVAAAAAAGIFIYRKKSQQPAPYSGFDNPTANPYNESSKPV